MQRGQTSKLRHFADKLAVKQIEPNLSTAQLMLVNEDLKPGMSSYIMPDQCKLMLTPLIVEPERRKWGPWNFVGFWIADSFNIVSVYNLIQTQLHP